MTSPNNDDGNSTNSRNPLLSEPHAELGSGPRRAFNRRALNMLGIGLILLAAVITLNSWSTVVDGNRRLAFDQIQVGMKREQVKVILGRENESRLASDQWSVHLDHSGLPVQHVVLELRWEDAYETVDIGFVNSTVETITRQPKPQPSANSVWQARLALAFLAAVGFLFLIEGFRPPRRSFVNAASPVPPTA